jgi:CubicO group peptidase (beta-lactamase class C family)
VLGSISNLYVRNRKVSNAIILVGALGIAACVSADDTRTDELGLAQLSADIDDGAFGRIAAIVVSQNGRALYEDYFGRAGPNSLIDMRSAGKSITGLAVGIAIDEGIIESAEAPALPYFPQIEPRDAAQADITVKDLLMMRSALDCGDWADSPGNEERMYRTRNWTSFVLDLPLDPAFVRGPDGIGRFRYCTAGSFLVGQIVAKQSRVSFDQYVAQRIFEPLGIEAVTWRRSPSGEVQSGGQMRIRARDMHRIGALVLNDGEWDGQQVIPKDWLTEMLQPWPVANVDFGYGYLWWIKDLRIGANGQSVTAQMMVGNGGNIVAVIPELSVVITVQAQNYKALDHFETSQAIIQGYVLPALASLN